MPLQRAKLYCMIRSGKETMKFNALHDIGVGSGNVPRMYIVYHITSMINNRGLSYMSVHIINAYDK